MNLIIYFYFKIAFSIIFQILLFNLEIINVFLIHVIIDCFMLLLQIFHYFVTINWSINTLICKEKY